MQRRISVRIEGWMILLAIGELAMAIATGNDGRIVAPEIGGVVELQAAPVVLAANATSWLVRPKCLESALFALLSFKLFFSHVDSPSDDESVDFVENFVALGGHAVEAVGVCFEGVHLAVHIAD